MKKITRRLLMAGMGLLLAIFTAAFTYTVAVQSPLNKSTTSAAFFFQATPTPVEQEDQSVIGSTDGIVAMGGIITLIVILPLLLRYKDWSHEEPSQS